MSQITNTSISTEIQLPMYIDTVREYLPQRYPFLMVDRVLTLEVGKSISGIKNVTINEEYLQGHFPAYPIMPGVLMIEAMAQISGILGLVTVGKKPSDGYTFLFAGVEKVRFKRQVVPGDTLELSAELIMQRQGIFKYACYARVDGKLAASAEIVLSEQQITL